VTAEDLKLERLGGLEEVREEWTALAERSGSVFATWEWASSWYAHLGGERPLHLIGCRRADGSLLAILPFFLASPRPLRVLRAIGHGPGDELGPVCAPADRELVAAQVRPALDLIGSGWDVLVVDNLPRDPAWQGMGGTATVAEIPNPVLEIEGVGWDEYLAARSSKFRQQFRRDERRLNRDHSLAYRLAQDPERLDGDLDTLFALHEKRWGEQSSGVFAAQEAAMQREFAHAAFERDWLRLWLMELDGKPVAARLGFRFGGIEFAYQAGRDRSWDRYGIGFVLQCHAIREAMNESAREFRLLRGGEAYKDRFGGVDHGLVSLAIARGLKGRTSLAAGRMALRLPPGGRRWLSRLAGSG
jgi:CelD/BcsL family acetyltransferase involved in cellulose biosynthesis